jgi:hypothetical protein
MYIGVYLCLAGILYIAGAVVVARSGSRLVRYSAITAGFVLAALVAFEALSFPLGLSRIGVAREWSYPGDYLERGVFGWLVMLLLPLGILVPALVACVLYRRAAHAL